MQELEPLATRTEADPFAGRTALYVGALSLAFVAAVIELTLTGYRLSSVWALVVLAAAAAVAERGRVQLDRGDRCSRAPFPTYPYCLLQSFLGRCPRCLSVRARCSARSRRPYLKARRLHAVAEASAGALTGLVAIQSSQLTTNEVGRVAVAVGIGGLALEVLDFGAVCLTARFVACPYCPLRASSSPSPSSRFRYTRPSWGCWLLPTRASRHGRFRSSLFPLWQLRASFASIRIRDVWLRTWVLSTSGLSEQVSPLQPPLLRHWTPATATPRGTQLLSRSTLAISLNDSA